MGKARKELKKPKSRTSQLKFEKRLKRNLEVLKKFKDNET
jgi:hypothetical protein